MEACLYHKCSYCQPKMEQYMSYKTLGKKAFT